MTTERCKYCGEPAVGDEGVIDLDMDGRCDCCREHLDKVARQSEYCDDFDYSMNY